MTQPVSLTLLDSTQTYEITQLIFDSASDGTATSAVEVCVYNAGSVAADPVYLNAIRCDFVRSAPAGEDSTETNANGGELVSETWLEARLDPLDAWTPLDEYANALNIGKLGVASFITVYLRLNIPAGAETIGECDFALCLRATTA